MFDSLTDAAANTGKPLVAPEAVNIAFVSTYPPQQCGLACFCRDMRESLLGASRGPHPLVRIGRSDDRSADDVPTLATVDPDRPETYEAAAAAVNASDVDAVCIQHEFGLFGGPSGRNLDVFLRRVEKPIVTILHTVLPEPSPDQRAAMRTVIAESARLVTMAKKGKEMLVRHYGVAPERIEVVPHGHPGRAPKDRAALRQRFGFEGRKILLTFGLLSPGKGIETVIEALPALAKRAPDMLYVVAGATHPAVKREVGEVYREGLAAKAEQLGVAGHLRFIDSYMDDDELTDLLDAADVYVTPYPNVGQITSGTLTFAFGRGLPVVSTPYWHAEELLGGGRGKGLGALVPFRDGAAIASAAGRLLQDDGARAALRKQIKDAAAPTSWPALGARYAALFADTAEEQARSRKVTRLAVVRRARADAAPSPRHLLRMTDDTGIAQHARIRVPDRAHGYCTDDCARVLTAYAAEGAPETDQAVQTCAAFLEHAWDEEGGRFRNFMGFDRRWLETSGSDDSNGRALWALGVTAGTAADPSLRLWAEHHYQRTRRVAGTIRSARGLAFAVLGEAGRRRGGVVEGEDLYLRFADLMTHQWAEVRKRADERGLDWPWFETSLAYDNARLPEALLAASGALGRDDLKEMALTSLAWLARIQDRGAYLNMVGTRSFGVDFDHAAEIDEQPVEACALVEAALAALRATGDPAWEEVAYDAFAWFHGNNRLGLPLVDKADGSCADGLHEDRINANRGAESVLAYAQAANALRAARRQAPADATGSGTTQAAPRATG